MTEALLKSIGWSMRKTRSCSASIRATASARPICAICARHGPGTDALVVAPLILCILAFAFYPQQALHQGEPAVRASLRPALNAGSSGQTAALPETTP